MREIFREDGIDSTGVIIFTIRYAPNISVKHKILYKNNLYEIYGIDNPSGADRFLRIWGKFICQ